MSHCYSFLSKTETQKDVISTIAQDSILAKEMMTALIDGKHGMMSNEDSDLRQAGMDLFSKLSISLAQKANEDTGRPLKVVMKDIRKKIRGKSNQIHSRPETL